MCLFFRADQRPNLYVFDVIQKVRGTDDVKRVESKREKGVFYSLSIAFVSLYIYNSPLSPNNSPTVACCQQWRCAQQFGHTKPLPPFTVVIKIPLMSASFFAVAVY